MDKLATVVYYTSNQEDEKFESKIREKLLKTIGDLPLISVSQKPIKNFGKNICVGEKLCCNASAFGQLLVGLKEAKTEFVIAAESDCLYPPEYFTFVPPIKDNAYRYDNVWLFYSWLGRNTRGLFWKKRYSEGAQMCGREHWIKRIEEVLEQTKKLKLKDPPIIFKTKLKYSWGTENPVISIKTGDGLRKYSGTLKEDSITPTDELPFWGEADKLRKELFEKYYGN